MTKEKIGDSQEAVLILHLYDQTFWQFDELDKLEKYIPREISDWMLYIYIYTTGLESFLNIAEVRHRETDVKLIY